MTTPASAAEVLDEMEAERFLVALMSPDLQARIDRACATTSPLTLTVLADGEDWQVREAVASNPSTSTDVLARLAVDACPTVRFAVAVNPAVPAHVLARLQADPVRMIAVTARLDAAGRSLCGRSISRPCTAVLTGVDKAAFEARLLVGARRA